jgi:AcrR family transcriptional regulator
MRRGVREAAVAMTATQPEGAGGTRRSRGRPPNPELRNAKHARMLKAAMDLFIQRGYEEVSVEEIARSAGQSKGAFYWYFKDKEDCVRQLIASLGKNLDEGLLDQLNAGNSARERLLKVSNFRHWCSPEFLQGLTLLRNLLHSRTPLVRQAVLDLAGNWWRNGYAMVGRLVREAARESGWSPEAMANFDFDAWVTCYLSCYDGIYTQLERQHTELPSTDRIADTIQHAFIKPFLQNNTPPA